MHIENISLQIKQKALEAGFSFCGISAVESLSNEALYLRKWLENGRNGEMHYMENHFDKRIQPNLLFENAKSVISVLLNYYPENKTDVDDKFLIAKYAYGKDYHYLIKSKLNEVIEFIKAELPEANARAFCDSAPVMEKVWAERGGLGWIGKNTCLIVPKAGSFFLIGEIITDIELIYDHKLKSRCGSCTICIEACPALALTSAYKLDARKCISYLTIEHKSEFPVHVNLHDNIFGCDICQDVCPWNIRFAKAHKVNELLPDEKRLKLRKADWINLTSKEFKSLFKNTALERTGYKRIMRNILHK